MKIRLIIFLLLPLSLLSQKNVQCTEGDKSLAFLKGEFALRIDFDYSNLTYDGIKDFQKFLVTRKSEKAVINYSAGGFTEDGNGAYGHIPLRPRRRSPEERSFLATMNKYTSTAEIYCSSNITKCKYRMVIEFNEATPFYRRGMDKPQIDFKLKNFSIKFIDNQTKEVKAVLTNSDYEKNFQEITFENIAIIFGEYIKKQLKEFD